MLDESSFSLLRLLSAVSELFTKKSIAQRDQNGSSSRDIQGSKRSTVNNLSPPPIKVRNLNTINVATSDQKCTDSDEFIETVKSYFKCSKCQTNDQNFKQCSYGHIFCPKCIKENGVFCSNCNAMIHNEELSVCQIAADAHASMKSSCQFCHKEFFHSHLAIHQRDHCPKRITNCDFQIYGCPWIGMASEKYHHKSVCDLNTLKVKNALELYERYIEKQRKLCSSENSLYKDFVSKISKKDNGSRFVVQEIALLKFQEIHFTDSIKFVIFQSSMIKLPFSCCAFHGFYLQLVIAIDSHKNTKKLRYIFKSENDTKVNLFYCLINYKLEHNDEEYKIIDRFHWHKFEPGNEESSAYEINSSYNVDESVISNMITANHVKLTLCVLGNDVTVNKSRNTGLDIEQLEMDSLLSLFMSTVRNLNENYVAIENPNLSIPTIFNPSNSEAIN